MKALIENLQSISIETKNILNHSDSSSGMSSTQSSRTSRNDSSDVNSTHDELQSQYIINDQLISGNALNERPNLGGVLNSSLDSNIPISNSSELRNLFHQSNSNASVKESLNETNKRNHFNASNRMSRQSDVSGMTSDRVSLTGRSSNRSTGNRISKSTSGYSLASKSSTGLSKDKEQQSEAHSFERNHPNLEKRSDCEFDLDNTKSKQLAEDVLNQLNLCSSPKSQSDLSIVVQNESDEMVDATGKSNLN